MNHHDLLKFMWFHLLTWLNLPDCNRYWGAVVRTSYLVLPYTGEQLYEPFVLVKITGCTRYWGLLVWTTYLVVPHIGEQVYEPFVLVDLVEPPPVVLYQGCTVHGAHTQPHPNQMKLEIPCEYILTYILSYHTETTYRKFKSTHSWKTIYSFHAIL